MKHTKEPWEVASDLPVYAIWSESEQKRIVQTINQNNWGTYGKSIGNVGIQKLEDAERIVACVNACKGITTEALEAGILTDSIAIHMNTADSGIDFYDNEYFYEGTKVFEEATDD